MLTDEPSGYSRQNPSPRYVELVAQYAFVHEMGLPDLKISGKDVFHGASLLRHLPTIRKLARAVHAKAMLDYGSGKGRYYDLPKVKLPDGSVIPNLTEYLGLETVQCYDPAVPWFSELPLAAFDIVVSTDALEHCPEEDLPWIVDEMFGLSRRFVFANVASYPAVKTLPNGENAHATQNGAAWWRALLEQTSQRYPEVGYHFEVEEFGTPNGPDGKGPLIRTVLSSASPETR